MAARTKLRDSLAAMTATSATTLTLFVDRFCVSPYVFSAFVALTEKGLPFEVHALDLKAGEHRKPAYARASLTARIPALQHGAFTLSESSAIAEYLEDAFPDRPRLLPADLQQRARARQVMAFVRSDLGPIREERSAETVFYPRTALPPLSQAARTAATRLFDLAGALVREDAVNAFGDAWCIADTDLAMMLQRLVHNGEDVPPGLAAYADRQWQRPSARRYIDRERAPFVPYAL